MRRLVVTYLIESPNKTDKGERILTGMWANDGKGTVKGTDIQIFDANTGDTIQGITDITLSVSGLNGITGKLRSLILMKNPKAGQEFVAPNGEKGKEPDLVPIVDTRGNHAYVEEDCLVVEMCPLNDEIIRKLRSIKDVPVKLAEDLKAKMAAAGEEADLTKGDKS